MPGPAVGRSSDLERNFRNPPESARPWVYWFIMDGNLTREGITADFEALKRAGIGGLDRLHPWVGGEAVGIDRFIRELGTLDLDGPSEQRFRG